MGAHKSIQLCAPQAQLRFIKLDVCCSSACSFHNEHVVNLSHLNIHIATGQLVIRFSVLECAQFIKQINAGIGTKREKKSVKFKK